MQSGTSSSTGLSMVTPAAVQVALRCTLVVRSWQWRGIFLLMGRARRVAGADS